MWVRAGSLIVSAEVVHDTGKSTPRFVRGGRWKPAGRASENGRPEEFTRYFFAFLSDLRFQQIQIDFCQAEAIGADIPKTTENFTKIQEVTVVANAIWVNEVEPVKTFGFCTAWILMGGIVVLGKDRESCLSKAWSTAGWSDSIQR
jgi:hypothetical protein